MLTYSIRSERLIAAISEATGVSVLLLSEYARRLRESSTLTNRALYVRENKSANSPTQGPRQAANLLLSAMQVSSTRNIAEEIRRAEETIAGVSADRLDDEYLNGARVWFVEDDQTTHEGRHAGVLAPLRDRTHSFVDALEVLVIAATCAPDLWQRHWSMICVEYDGDRHEGYVQLFFAKRYPDKAELIGPGHGLHYTIPYPQNELRDLRRRSTLSGDTFASVGKAMNHSIQ
jgi:hypothetical protein